ncbi:hypothetical protein F5Y19DRAFT_432090 [Xylariaceae sp. FL1651]|nr:hypothetical protein F5Y19DRAFT_432090 [Xylariaceae sp. FL1651]
MCYYQNIHTTYHHGLLNIDAPQREQHRCGHRYPDYKADKCPMHTCCQLTREVIISCQDVAEVDPNLALNTRPLLGEKVLGVDKTGEYGTGNWSDGDVCENAFLEDVFVPFLEEEKWLLLGVRDNGNREDHRGVSGDRADTRLDAIANGRTAMTDSSKSKDAGENKYPSLEFWSHDHPGITTRVYPDDLTNVREADDTGKRQEGAGNVWRWFPCLR